MKHPPCPVPIGSLDEHLGIFGTTGSGKSYTARVLVEHLARSYRSPVYLVDPKGDWWGVRLSADGKGPGLSFLIVGGPHADEGLQIPEQHPETIAAALADMLATSDQSVIFDLSELGPEAMRRFVKVLVQRLYEKRRDAYTLVIDEADEFAPNTSSEGGEGAKCLSVVARMAKRGRGRGCRLWTVSQRPAGIHTDVRGQMQSLAVMKLTLTHDIKAVRDWMTNHDAEKAREISATFTGLRNGKEAAQLGKGAEGWFWSPGHGFLARIEWPRITTYDSMATPAHGERRSDVAPKPIDTGALRKALAEQVKAAEENDPKRLRERIRKLEGELAKKPQPAAAEEIKAELAAEYSRGWTDGKLASNAAHKKRISQLQTDLLGVVNQAKHFADECNRVWDRGEAAGTSLEHAGEAESPSREAMRTAPRTAVVYAAVPLRLGDPVYPTKTAAIPGDTLAERILNAVAFFNHAGHDRPTKDMVAALLGYHPKTKSYANAVGKLRSDGELDRDADGMRLTRPRKWTGTGTAAGMVLSHLGGRRRQIFERLLQSPASKDALAAGFGLHPNTKSFANDLGALSGLGVTERVRGELRVAEWIGGAA